MKYKITFANSDHVAEVARGTRIVEAAESACCAPTPQAVQFISRKAKS